METLHDTWRATFVRRWHCNVDMNHVEDFTSSHSARMATLVLRLWPNCRKELLAALITHDIGERKVGDFPYDFKRANPGLAAQIGDMEDVAVVNFVGKNWVGELTEGEHRMLKLVDRLDSHLLVLMRNPALAATRAWQNQLQRDYDTAEALGVLPEIMGLVRDAERKVKNS